MASEGLQESPIQHVTIPVVTGILGGGPQPKYSGSLPIMNSINPSTGDCMKPVLAGAAGRRACAE